LIGNDLELSTAGKETVTAGVASLVEAVGFWLIATYAPSAGRAMVFPLFVAALIYKIAHFEDWNRNDVLMFMAFQAVIVIVGMSLAHGHFLAAILILAGFALFLGLVAAFARSL